ncbi:hypothetical protein AAF712_006717 [Marasmius tenuissimus]|uniref:Enoyl reductase (ER) domain-containing protein n=1 Tax=Marasmius tenuissimus TaxID=585030 RepID=A0ABR2ZZ04_9AGAR
MTPVRNARVLMKEYPGDQDYPEPGKHTVYDGGLTIDLDNVPLKNGEFLVKMLYFSIDPSIRVRMRILELGKPITNFGIGVVVCSENPDVKTGNHIEGVFDIQEYNIRNALKAEDPTLTLNIIDNPHNIPWSVFVGAAGMPGKTAYYGWKEVAHAKAGEVVYVSTGAGPVGSFVIQLAKKDGLKVIASAGSEEKVKFLKHLGVDVAFNYKTTKTSDVLAKEGPIDIYWDNVGGEMLDAAIAASNRRARIIACGATAGYNSGGAEPVRNLAQIMYKNITIYGFYIYEHDHKYKEEFYKTVPEWIAKGQIKYAEEVYDGLEKVGEAILAQQKGQNVAKSVVKVSDE